jgi:hypothetical protein
MSARHLSCSTAWKEDPIVTVPNPTHEAELELRLAEYKELKAEQRARIERRDHLVYATLTAIVAATAAAVKVPVALLLLAPAVLILGWTHLINDAKVTAAGEYLRGPLSRRLANLAGIDGGARFGELGAAGLGWEVAHRADSRRYERKQIQLVVDVATFVAPALGGLAGYVVLGDPPAAAWVAIVALAGVAGVLGRQQLAYAEIASPAAGLRQAWRRISRRWLPGRP